ncbi:DUF262 domain-containing protein [Halomonas sp. MCCC 1A17488]|uniref:DUF262 domain-containing protein n=1 Tax=unclassified Halomonas TaxID=2609666 RepID=UPI0018D22195|nr:MULTISPECIES: DUF262 domain-containing protein [unclassified Halomonas]MCE8017706.1 DUF262 domain-containing protein [Halomonas sp. MCCC 1A17488]MCG3241039.1 DUF262 domain-containing protein [Halomonas sp. MCCC 1A17488]QPP48901.1 DUF262 domain-containing protein [Halomonas sp. SS10-MC5]
MITSESFLHTTHRTVSWFNKANQREELVLAAPFQRNPVWTDRQKSYLIDTILHGLPVPELYMVDTVDDNGEERHIVVDGQQRIRACLDFIEGGYELEGGDLQARWVGLKFEDLSPEEKQLVFSYKFVVRVLPNMPEEELRKIFARLNRNVVALNEQELRNATYWGPFIKAIQEMADQDPFWSEAGVFSANDHRRMLDHEFLSEMAVAFLHGPQNKKDKLDYYYQLYEREFEAKEDLVRTFRAVTGEISQLLPDLVKTRWRKKSDFYTLYLCLAEKTDDLPFSQDVRERVSGRIRLLGEKVDALARLEEEDWEEPSPDVARYARAVARAASDKGNRVARANAFNSFVFEKEASNDGD